MTGPCAWGIVRCTIVAADGRRWVGENSCHNPQSRCPRLPGEGYAKCRNVCDQPTHAEVAAARLVPRRDYWRPGIVAYIEGHDYACWPCLDMLRSIGVGKVRFSPPPAP